MTPSPDTAPAVGTDPRPLRVAIVGAGPGGFYAAEALLKAEDLRVRVDLFDRLPTPFGLVRGGVAPDHQSIKKVTRVYEKVVEMPGVRFFGNVSLGRDLTVEDLRRCYDAIIYAVGNESDRPMGIPGEELPGSHSATELVGWYNGHPDFRDRNFDLSVGAAAVVGVGNVAMDVARILVRDPSELAPTDMASYAVEALRASGIHTVYVLGRRGAAQAAFSPKEIKELGSLAGVQLVVRPEEVALDPVSAAWLEGADRDAQKNMEYLTERAQDEASAGGKRIVLRFLVSPEALVAGPDGRVGAIRLRKNRLGADGRGVPRPEPTDEVEDLPVGIVFKAVGYRGIPVPGVPFDTKAGIIPNREGRVLAAAGAQETLPGEYVVGWAKRGPSGLIGTNKPDSIATVENLLADVRAPAGPAHLSAADAPDVATLLDARSVPWFSLQDWRRIDAAELARGEAAGKIREKFSTIDEMLPYRQR